ncbi:hypothetical protein SASPL_149972 [Salvia splendens]|uniref:non-specific serine/threonine protein kinase n=1 Tax=Salvia splendens TaxID=180675 RepID=A0A8X8Z283_SALSN|nr:phytosulfokine receptor 2-like [Salvia splendens]KAG6388544.1 hypothetical protein SASPL_149972 [Salvia splendens]
MDQTLQGILAAIASFFVVTLILGLILILCNTESNHHHRRRRRSHPSPSIFDSFDPSLPHVSMQELVAATHNFSKDLIIGDGSFGLVYKATLRSGAVVAVKKLSPDAFQGLREFQAEIETLAKIRHPNIVRILGYCATGQDRVLIYEFIEKGSLDQWLYDTSDEEADVEFAPLTWNSRMGLVRGVADGLAYMHHELAIPIIHRDIKASNVLLDSGFVAHIADFGLARRVEGPHSHVSTQVAGTMGYMPPEYVEGFAAATTAGDVYSFGVLVVEVVTGRRPSLPFPGEDGREVRLMEWAKAMAGAGRYVEMVDGCIAREDLEKGVVEEVFKIGLECAHHHIKNRPTMNQVVDQLNSILGVVGSSKFL